ncbi:MAG: hypothetical protein JJU29_03740 [Verrucomicrobia bacterium]|nr:hypothetical protein [Verrucomicrobiota bacterium]MCH8510919.1 Mur ligase domain-containing protein [Kiritimatiellia bacterium]
MNDLPAHWLASPTRVHLIGVGGVGMAGVARLLQQGGFVLSGSDTAPNRLTEGFQAKGGRFFRGHAVAHLDDDVVWAVRTPAVGEDNPEVAALRARHIPVFARGDVLAAFSRQRQTVAVAGAHGKTTTSAMLTHLLRNAGIECGYAIGGETGFPGRVGDAGTSPWFVCEADESDGTLVQYAPEIGVLTHVEWDHVERFSSEAALMRCYRAFARRCGTLVVRADDALAMEIAADHPRVIRVGENPKLLSAQSDPTGQEMEVEVDGQISRLRLPLPGKHQAWNALLAITAAHCACGVSRFDLSDFVSVGRRFERHEVAGVTVIHDYAHHPTEVRALMDSVRALGDRRVVAAFQPHRYSRTRHLLEGFADAFRGVASLHLLPVYAASEGRERGVDSDALAVCCRQRNPGLAVGFHRSRTELAGAVMKELGPEDIFMVVGAGDILMVVPMILEQLKEKEIAHA